MRYYPIFSTLLIALSLLSLSPAMAHKAKKSARVFIESPTHETSVQDLVKIKFGAEGITIAQVGVNKHRTGHHILLIDVKEPISMDDVVPMDEQHLHYSKGETEAEIRLAPGKHTLQLVLADEEHLPWAEWLVSKPITITVTPSLATINPQSDQPTESYITQPIIN